MKLMLWGCLAVLLLGCTKALHLPEYHDFMVELQSTDGSKEEYPNPNLQDVIPPLTDKGDEAELVEREEAQGPVRQIHFPDNINLRWEEWTGSLPEGAVSIWNSYTSRTDNVCAEPGCAVGFYSPATGPYCYYPYGDREYRTSTFRVLVNLQDFESLEWKSGSYGSIPENSIGSCSRVNIYVGKNKYGLGKVDTHHEAFFLPYEGKEYWYKSYEVLSIFADYKAQKISDVQYLKDEIKFYQQPPQLLASSRVINNDCKTVKKTATLSRRTTVEQRWDIGRSTKFGVNSTISAGIPKIVETSLTISAEVSFDWREGTTRTESVTHIHSLEMEVQPNHVCEVIMEGREMTADMPFSATLTRFYGNGETRSTMARGAFIDVQIGAVTVHVKRCQPIPDAEPCY
ncbi:natterin-3-like [Lissotriton helveticus]